MQAGAANTAIKARAQCGHGVYIGAKDEGLDHVPRLDVIALGCDPISDNHNGRTV
jgi:hypothetical protein